MRNHRLLPAVVIVAASVIALSGCSSIEDSLRQEASSRFATSADLVADWDKTAPWVPDDAIDIDTHETTDGDVAILRASTDSDLPSSCVETERRSAAQFDEEWSGDSYGADTVFACDDWSVIAVDGGWYGWTPNHPDEKAASEQAGQ